MSEQSELLRTYLQTECGLPRRKITALIDEGKILLNSQPVQNYKTTVWDWDLIQISELGLSLTVKKTEKADSASLLAFHKPMGYTCSKSDPHNPTFYELLPAEFRQKYYYIGRLDKESRGLVLLTESPRLVHEFEHPSKHITKEYHILLNKPFNRKLESKILAGIQHEGELLRTLKLYPISANQLGIVLNEGKKRHIRRIFKVLGYEVIDLLRVRIWNFLLGDLPEGKWEEVSDERVK